MTVYQYIKTETDRKKLYNGIRAILEEKEFLFESCTVCKNPRFWIYEVKSPFIAD